MFEKVPIVLYIISTSTSILKKTMFVISAIAMSIGFCVILLVSLLYSNLQYSRDVSYPLGDENICSLKSPSMEFREAYNACRLKRFE